jgi:glycosyltransferase involved in cell wall biosynthesis
MTSNGSGDWPPNSGIIAFSHLRWDFVWQRPQQFLSRFAADRPVLFIEEPEFILDAGAEPTFWMNQSGDNVTVLRMRFPVGTTLDERFLAQMRELATAAVQAHDLADQFRRPLLWFYNPMDATWAMDLFNESGIVYDCMDELSQFRFAPTTLVENEKRLLNAADVVFTGGYELWLKKSAQHDNAHFFGCGVEYDHFAKAQDKETPIPTELQNLEGPVIGWFGVVDERVDYDLVAKAAEMKPEWNFVLVGPVVKVDPTTLPRRENIHWLGQRDYKDLPSYCRAFDVCMMCFALNEATEYINPTKALEYLATGKPVISTAVRDVVRQYEGLIDIANTPEEFVQLAEKALSERNDEKIQKGIEKAGSCSWECTVEQMTALINEALSKKKEPASVS